MNSKNIRLQMDINTPNAKMPTYSSGQAAGLDLYAAESASIASGQTRLIKTGLKMEIPEGYFGGIYARSGLSVKHGLRPANCTGVIDSDYRGEIMVALHNDSPMMQIISAGDRIAQLIIQPYERVEFTIVDDLSDTERGEGGFGSTGI